MSSVSTSFSVVYGVRQRINSSYIVGYDVRNTMSPTKLISIGYDVRRAVYKSIEIRYEVRISIGSPKTFTVQYGVRQRVQNSFSVVYNTFGSGSGGAFSTAFSSAFDSAVGGSATVVSKVFGIVYQTLITPSVDKIIVVPIEKDPSSTQTITTSFLDGSAELTVVEYQTMVNPGRIIVVPIGKDSVPPQIITTSF